MNFQRSLFLKSLVVLLALGLAASCGFRRKKYENPISKDSKQPDKVLFDKAVDDIEHGRYEIARITLNTLINTYDQSEYLAKSKLAIADSWYREGGGHGLAQAEAEYKDFELFYPTMPESAEAQNRVCMIHYKQMDKPDRDPKEAIRAEDECRQLLVQFPNSHYAKEAEQRLRNIQEGIAEGEFRAGFFYYKKGSNPAAANRFSRLVEQYPLYSKSDEALWLLGDTYSKMGTRFRNKAGDAYSRIVHDYPLSSFSDDAKSKLKELELPVPQADPAALARMQYDADHPIHLSLTHRALSLLSSAPDVTHAAQNGAPAMTNLQPTIPASVPLPAGAAAAGFSGDVTVSQVGPNSALDNKPDARLGGQPQSAAAAPAADAKDANGNPLSTAAAGGNAAPKTEAPQIAQSNQGLPVNHPFVAKPQKKKKHKKQLGNPDPAAAAGEKPAAGASPAAAPPAPAPAPN